jgi:hypothetical protein
MPQLLHGLACIALLLLGTAPALPQSAPSGSPWKNARPVNAKRARRNWAICNAVASLQGRIKR